MKRNPMFRALALVLVLSMILSASPVAYAWSFKDLFRSEGSNNALSIEQIDGVDVDVKLDLEPVEHPYQEEKYAATESVRVSIVLNDMPPWRSSPPRASPSMLPPRLTARICGASRLRSPHPLSSAP